MKSKKKFCRSCNNTILKKIKTYKSFPLKLWPTLKKDRYLNEDLEVCICSKCKLVQLQRFKGSLDKYYGKSFVLPDKKGLKLRADRIKDNYPSKYFKNKKIIEVGGGRNSLLPFFNSKEKWLCDFDIDPQEHSSADKIISNDFIKARIPKAYFDAVFIFHTLEHVEDIDCFLKKIFYILNENGIVFVEVPDLNIYTKNNPNYAFFFQHRTIFEKKTLQNIFQRHNFNIDQEIINNDKNILLHSYKKINFKKNILNVDERKIKKIFKNLKVLKNRSVEIFKKNSNNNIAIYGAGGTTISYLYHLGAKKELIKYCYDIDKRKHGKYMPMTDIIVHPIERIKIDNPDILLFTNEKILKDFKKKYKSIKCIAI